MAHTQTRAERAEPYKGAPHSLKLWTPAKRLPLWRRAAQGDTEALAEWLRIPRNPDGTRVLASDAS